MSAKRGVRRRAAPGEGGRRREPACDHSSPWPMPARAGPRSARWCLLFGDRVAAPGGGGDRRLETVRSSDPGPARPVAHFQTMLLFLRAEHALTDRIMASPSLRAPAPVTGRGCGSPCGPSGGHTRTPSPHAGREPRARAWGDVAVEPRRPRRRAVGHRSRRRRPPWRCPDAGAPSHPRRHSFPVRTTVVGYMSLVNTADGPTTPLPRSPSAGTLTRGSGSCTAADDDAWCRCRPRSRGVHSSRSRCRPPRGCRSICWCRSDSRHTVLDDSPRMTACSGSSSSPVLRRSDTERRAGAGPRDRRPALPAHDLDGRSKRVAPHASRWGEVTEPVRTRSRRDRARHRSGDPQLGRDSNSRYRPTSRVEIDFVSTGSAERAVAAAVAVLVRPVMRAWRSLLESHECADPSIVPAGRRRGSS